MFSVKSQVLSYPPVFKGCRIWGVYVLRSSLKSRFRILSRLTQKKKKKRLTSYPVCLLMFLAAKGEGAVLP